MKIKFKNFLNFSLLVKNYYLKKGFTLLEMLVALFVLTILVVGVSGIYVYSLKVQKETTKLNLVAQEVQFIMDGLTKRIRSGEIDYDYYGGTISSPTETLALIIGNKEFFYKKDDNQIVFCTTGRGTSCTDFIPLSTQDLKVNDLKFYVQPNSSPFGSSAPLQPRVTILLKVQGAGEEITIQQTVPQRYFERK